MRGDFSCGRVSPEQKVRGLRYMAAPSGPWRPRRDRHHHKCRESFVQQHLAVSAGWNRNVPCDAGQFGEFVGSACTDL